MSNLLYQIFEAVKQRKQQGEDIIELNVGEPDQSPPQSVIAALSQVAQAGQIKYGPASGEPGLKAAIAKKYRISPESIVVGPGSKFLVYALLHSLLASPQDEVIIPTPTWAAYASMVTTIGRGKTILIPTSPKNGWDVAVATIEKHLSPHTKVILICNPNNPTSLLTPETTIKRISLLCQRHKIHLIIDQAYEGLVFTRTKPIPKNLPHTSYCLTFSKEYAMTGFRLGFVITTPELVQKLVSFNQLTITSVPQFIQAAGALALEKETAFPKKLQEEYQHRAKLAQSILKKAGCDFVPPDSGLYIFPDIHRDSETFCLKLLDRGVATVPGSAFGPYPTHIRISLTEKTPRLETGLTIITKLLKST